jgi:homoserine kinase
VAAALLGGLTVSCSTDGGIVAVTLAVPPEIGWVVLVPEVESSTREARAVLPDTVARVDAVFNVQRVSLLLAALECGRPSLLGMAMGDRLHQPYRLRLFPWMSAVERAARDAGALGCALSGAGSAVIAAVQGSSDGVARAMEDALHAAGAQGRALSLAVDTAGAVWERSS